MRLRALRGRSTFPGRLSTAVGGAQGGSPSSECLIFQSYKQSYDCVCSLLDKIPLRQPRRSGSNLGLQTLQSPVPEYSGRGRTGPVHPTQPLLLLPPASPWSLCVHVWGCSSSCSQAWPPSKPRCVGAIGVAWSCFRRRNPGQRPSRDPECGSEGSAECWADIITLPPNPCLWGILEQGPHVSGSEGGAVLNSPPRDAHCLGVYLDLLTQLVNLFLF